MWGTRGTVRRRRIILAEFSLGFVAAVAFGAWVLATSSDIGGRLFGAWIIGAGINYAPLTAYAVLLTRPGALDHELHGVDVRQELRRYGVLQLWLVIPLMIPIFAVHRELSARRRPTRQ